MIDIKLIRENPGKIKAAMKSRNADMDAVIDELLDIDRQRREISTKTDEMKNEQNLASKEIPRIKKDGGDTAEIMEKMKALSEKIKENDGKISILDEKQKTILLNIPNIPHDSVPAGESETDNIEVRKIGTQKAFDFEPKPHWDIGADLDILDSERAAKVTGARFHFYKNLGARLERAIINFYLDTHTKNGYTEILAPYLVNRASMTGTGQLPKFEEDAFKTVDGLFLIPTAEVPVTNYHRDEILDGDTLPIKYCAYTACFREEAGSAGRDTRGLIRQHQFNKVELVAFATQNNSFEVLEKLTNDAENLLKELEIPYRVVELCTGDLGFCSAKTYDIEVWMPSYGKYLEISSCSNFMDFQARRANIRYREKAGEKPQFVHTLNGSGLAAGRTTAAILENYQQADGSVIIPKVLRPYMGVDRIGK